MCHLERFTDFLKTVNLKQYREQYSHIKIVEMDLDKDIQAIPLLYKIYWTDKRFISFDEFYEIYYTEKLSLLEAFRNKVTMCENCFCRGIKARIYRTWAGLITQIHGGYVAEAVFGEGSVDMSRELDSKGADIRIRYKEHFLNYQVKKQSFSGVAGRRPQAKTKQLEGEAIDIYYEVPSCLTNPLTMAGEMRTPYKRFLEDKRTEALDNGFVIFTKEAFLPKKIEIDNEN